MLEYHHKLNFPEFNGLAAGILGSGLFAFSIFSERYEISIVAGILVLIMLIAYMDKCGTLVRVYFDDDYIYVKSNRKISFFRDKKIQTNDFNKSSIKVGHVSTNGSHFYHYDLILHGDVNTEILLRVNNESDAKSIRDYINEKISRA